MGPSNLKMPERDRINYPELFMLFFIKIKYAHLTRRIKTEEKAKVVAAVWGTYLNAALTI